MKNEALQAAAAQVLADACWNIQATPADSSRPADVHTVLVMQPRVLAGYVKADLLTEEQVREALTTAATAAGHDLQVLERGLWRAFGRIEAAPLFLRALPSVDELTRQGAASHQTNSAGPSAGEALPSSSLPGQ